MARLLPWCALVLIAPLAHAQEVQRPTKYVVKLTVQPAPAPKPAMRYQLYPELQEMNPGNPIHAYLICFMEQNHFYHNPASIANRELWSIVPAVEERMGASPAQRRGLALKDLPLQQLRDYGGAGLRQADYAARLDTVDWQVLMKMRRDGAGLLLPEVQHLRMLAGALKVRLRGEVAEQRYDDAIRTFKTMFALSSHLSEHPTLIGGLVGLAITHLALEVLDEMLEQPNCPNLFWALRDLPTPLIKLRKGVQGERFFIQTHLGGLKSDEVLSDEQLGRVMEQMQELLALASGAGGPPKVRDWLDERVKSQSFVQEARNRLLASGMKEALVKKFKPAQVVLLDEKLSFETERDEGMKWMNLPYWQAEEGLQHFEALSKETGDSLLSKALLPALIKVRRAALRAEQRIALITHVEAIRMYAADNGGKLPRTLADIKLPLPVDPATGKPFSYSVEGETAIMEGKAPKGEEKNMASNLRYEVKLRR